MISCIDDMTVEQYLEWKKQRYSDKDILEMLHYQRTSDSVIQKWKRERGLVKTDQTRVKVMDRLCSASKFLDFKKMGKSNLEIAEHLGVAIATLEKWIREQKKNGLLPKGKIHPYNRVTEKDFMTIDVDSDNNVWF